MNLSQISRHVVQPVLEYDGYVCESCLQCNALTFERMQLSVTRSILRATRRAVSNAGVLKAISWPTLAWRRRRQKLFFFCSFSKDRIHLPCYKTRQDLCQAEQNSLSVILNHWLCQNVKVPLSSIIIASNYSALELTPLYPPPPPPLSLFVKERVFGLSVNPYKNYDKYKQMIRVTTKGTLKTSTSYCVAASQSDACQYAMYDWREKKLAYLSKKRKIQQQNCC